MINSNYVSAKEKLLPSQDVPKHPVPSILSSSSNNFTLSHTHTVFVVTVPPKIWRPQAPIKYLPHPPRLHVDDDFFLRKQYSYVVKKIPFLISVVRDDLIDWGSDRYGKELQDNLRINDDMHLMIKLKVISLVQEHWDAFDEGGVSRPVIGCDFCIDNRA